MSIGTDIPRVDGIEKLRGTARYVDDLKIEGILHAGTVRSKIARGRIRKINFDPAINWSEYTIVDHRDIVGPNEIKLIELDQPALVVDEIRHKEEPILLIAHPCPRAIQPALRAITIDIDPRPAVTDPQQKLTPDLVQFGSDNVFKKIDIHKGDPESILQSATRVIKGEYRTGGQEHVYLENQGMIAYHEDDKLVVTGTMQCPYYVLDALTHFFDRPPDAFRVVQTPTGGGFGGKEDFPSNMAIHAALLAEKSGKPVKLIYDRQEDMAATTKRHPGIVRHRTAVDDNGKLLAMDIEVIFDGGAYMTLSPVVLSRGVIHAAGPYNCDNIHVHGEARLTNTPPNGAFRGFGAPQTIFAVERHMDVIADQLGIDPVALRRRNLIKDGDSTATNQPINDGVDRIALMDNTLDVANYHDKIKQHAEFNREHPYTRRGIGFATFLHGAGFTGAGEVWLASEAWVEGHPDGGIEVLVANTDMGQGTTTILTQIAADQLELEPRYVILATPDTSRVPNSGPTVASRTAMIVGRLIEQACDKIVDQTGGQKGAALTEAIQAWHLANPGSRLIGKAKYQKPDVIVWDDEKYIGHAYACYGWATYVADVEIDLRTFNVRVLDFVASQEIGRVLNPTLARGQIQGGVVQGIGWALTEEIVTRDGAMANNQMTNYIIPTSGDLPPIRVIFEESDSPFGPRGAKGIGELPMDGPAPAILNAISHALETQLNDIPMTPEKLMLHMEEQTIGAH